MTLKHKYMKNQICCVVYLHLKCRLLRILEKEEIAQKGLVTSILLHMLVAFLVFGHNEHTPVSWTHVCVSFYSVCVGLSSDFNHPLRGLASHHIVKATLLLKVYLPKHLLSFAIHLLTYYVIILFGLLGKHSPRKLRHSCF